MAENGVQPKSRWPNSCSFNRAPLAQVLDYEAIAREVVYLNGPSRQTTALYNPLGRERSGSSELQTHHPSSRSISRDP